MLAKCHMEYFEFVEVLLAEELEETAAVYGLHNHKICTFVA
jgi:hypothetical protein